MGDIKIDEPEWTKENLLKLLAALKTSIGKNYRLAAYNIGLRAVDWNTVAFDPFSPEECQEKWKEILRNMRKRRTLTELIDEAEEVISDPTKTERCNKRLLNCPKRPCPPNSMFYLEKCAAYAQKHPKMNSQKILSALNKKYKKLPDEEKARYEERHRLASEEYQEKMRAFRKKYGLKSKKKGVPNDQGEEHSENEDGLPPKPPHNGYTLFCHELRTSSLLEPGKNIFKCSSQRWRDLPQSQRHMYSKRCAVLRKEYLVKLQECLSVFDEEELEQILRKHGIKKRKWMKNITKCKVLPGQPKMPPLTGSAMFYSDQMEHLKGNSKKHVTKINQMWQSLSKSEKRRHEERSQEEIRKYTTELKNWFETLTPAMQKEFLTKNPRKKQFLDAEQSNDSERPSDSEDENMESSSSSDKGEILNESEDEECEGDEGDETFEIF